MAVVQPSFIHLFVRPSICLFIRLSIHRLSVHLSSFVHLSIIICYTISTSQQWLQVLGTEAGGRRDVGCSFVVVVGYCMGCGSGGMVVGGVGCWVVGGGWWWHWLVWWLVGSGGVGWWAVGGGGGGWWHWVVVGGQ
jgi:hypothetical protein